MPNERVMGMMERALASRQQPGTPRRLLRWIVALNVLTTCLSAPVLAGQTQASEAAIVAKQALDYYQNGNPAMAAELYRRAFQLDPTKADYLFGVGRAEQKAGHSKQAVAAYENVVALLPGTNALARKAQKALKDLATEAALSPPPEVAKRPPDVEKPPTAAAKPPVPSVAPVVVQPVPAASDWHKPVGLSLVAVSGASAVALVILAVLASKNQSDLNGFKLSTGFYDATRITPPEVGSRQASINSLWTGAAIAGGVAAVAGGAGAWALISAPKQGMPAKSMSLTPGPGDLGMGLAWSF